MCTYIHTYIYIYIYIYSYIRTLLSHLTVYMYTYIYIHTYTFSVGELYENGTDLIPPDEWVAKYQHKEVYHFLSLNSEQAL